MTDQAQTCGLADRARRRFLQGAGVAMGAAALPFTPLASARAQEPDPPRPLDEPVSSQRRWGIVVDSRKCEEGCDACVRACIEENHLEGSGHDTPQQKPQWIRVVSLENKLSGHKKQLPVMCQHCANPPCVDVCPTGASFKRKDGIVLVDKHICIGCRYCLMACPYKARNFVHEPLHDQAPYSPRGKGTAEACTMCVHRVDLGLQPACVQKCQKEGGGALTFGDWKDREGTFAQANAEADTAAIRADLGTDPGVRYTGI